MFAHKALKSENVLPQLGEFFAPTAAYTIMIPVERTI
jgi:hypothetical protein